MTQFNPNPKIILSQINTELKKGVKERKHSFHAPIFSNIDEKNNVNSRIVVMREFNKKTNIINFHTDFRSKKILEISYNSKTSFVYYDPKRKIQLRIKTISSIHHDDSITKKAWEKTSLSSRKCYLSRLAPSSSVDIADDGIPSELVGIDPNINESEKGYKNFAVIKNKIISIDWLKLSSSGHRRLLIICDKSFKKYQWLIP